MDKIGELAARIFSDLRPILDWAIRNWAVTTIALAILIFWAGKQKRLDRRQL